MIHLRKVSRRSTAILAALAVTALAAGAATAGHVASPGFDSNHEVALPGAELDFQHVNPAIQMATAWGDRAVGAHGTFGKFPPEFITPWHTHSAAYHGVVIKGVMTNPFKDDPNVPEMGPGSYWYVPAEAVHATACISKEPCEFYFSSESAFDFKPVE